MSSALRQEADDYDDATAHAQIISFRSICRRVPLEGRFYKCASSASDNEWTDEEREG